MRDEIHRLKGEQGTPQVQSNTPPSPRPDHASDQERRTPKAWSQGRTTDRIPIDRAQVVQSDPACLPPDAVCKGYEDGVVQDVLCRTDKVLVHQETWSSPSQPQTSWASLPPGSSGPCGPGLKRLGLALSCGAQRSEPKVAERWRSGGGADL